MIKVSYKRLDQEQPCLEVSIDGEFWRYLDTRVFRRIRELPKSCRDEAELTELIREFECKKAKLTAYRMLTAQSLNSHQLSTKLKNKAYAKYAIESAVAGCTELGYVNDEEWAEMHTRRLVRQKYGRSQISIRLRQKGVSNDLVEEVMERCIEPEDMSESMQRLLDTRYRRYDLKDPKERKKVAASLVRRGFSFDQIWDALG